MALIGLYQTHCAFGHNTLTAATSTDNKIDLSPLKGSVNILQDIMVAK